MEKSILYGPRQTKPSRGPNKKEFSQEEHVAQIKIDKDYLRKAIFGTLPDHVADPKNFLTIYDENLHYKSGFSGFLYKAEFKRMAFQDNNAEPPTLFIWISRERDKDGVPKLFVVEGERVKGEGLFQGTIAHYIMRFIADDAKKLAEKKIRWRKELEEKYNHFNPLSVIIRAAQRLAQIFK